MFVYEIANRIIVTIIDGVASRKIRSPCTSKAYEIILLGPRHHQAQKGKKRLDDLNLAHLISLNGLDHTLLGMLLHQVIRLFCSMPVRLDKCNVFQLSCASNSGLTEESDRFQTAVWPQPWATYCHACSAFVVDALAKLELRVPWIYHGQ